MSAHRPRLLKKSPARRLPSDTPAPVTKGVKALGRAGASEYSFPPLLSWRFKKWAPCCAAPSTNTANGAVPRTAANKRGKSLSDLFFRAIRAQDKVRKLMRPPPKQGQNQKARLSEEQIKDVLCLWSNGVRKIAIASMTSLSPTSVYNIINRYKLVGGRVTHIKRETE